MNIEIGKTYNHFDDGKIRESRRSPVTITEIIPFDQVDEETFNRWREEVQKFDWLFAKETDFFIKGLLEEVKNNPVEITYVRTLQQKWFSLSIDGWSGGILDVDGSLSKELKS